MFTPTLTRPECKFDTPAGTFCNGNCRRCDKVMVSRQQQAEARRTAAMSQLMRQARS